MTEIKQAISEIARCMQNFMRLIHNPRLPEIKRKKKRERERERKEEEKREKKRKTSSQFCYDHRLILCSIGSANPESYFCSRSSNHAAMMAPFSVQQQIEKQIESDYEGSA